MRRPHRLAFGSLAAFAVCAALYLPGESVVVPASSAAGGVDKVRERAERALREGEYETAEKLYREMLGKNAHDSTARLGLSSALLKQRKHQDAFDHAARVIAVDPMSARAHSLLGAALLGSGDFRLSVEEFRTALSFKESDAQAIAGLAMVDFYENRLGQSLVGLRRAAFIDPSEPDYQFNLGQVAARSERYSEAADAYERFLRIAPRADADRRARIRGLIDFLRYLGTQGSLLRTSGSARNEIPFELVNNRPTIRVRVNGSKEPLRFVVDTGAGMCVLASEAANRLGVKSVARGGLARAVGGGGRFEIVYGFLQSLTIGEARIEHVPVYLRQFYNDQEPVDGYIGLSVLSKFLTSIDYGKRMMTMLKDDARPVYNPAAPPVGIELPIRTTSSGFWSGEIKLDGVEKPISFIIDTGASISVVSEALATREDLFRFVQPSRIKVYGAAGVTDNVKMLLLPQVALGTHARRHVTMAVLDMEPINETAGFEQTGIIGGNVLRFYRVTFDFERAILRLEPLDAVPPAERKDAAPVVTSQS
jgi:predicted aspartyl protease/Flp pilus assembly protein TadD